MKIRSGFVSNSSSSSFVVRVNDMLVFDENNRHIRFVTDEQIMTLKDFGFKYTMSTYPEELFFDSDWTYAEDREPDDDGFIIVSMGMKVNCNQGDVVDFLVKNKIPFLGYCHYGHYSLVCDGKELIEIPNFGIEYGMYQDEGILSEISKECGNFIKRTKIDEN